MGARQVASGRIRGYKRGERPWGGTLPAHGASAKSAAARAASATADAGEEHQPKGCSIMDAAIMRALLPLPVRDSPYTPSAWNWRRYLR